MENSITEINSDKLYLLWKYIGDRDYFYKFEYKMEIKSEKDMDFIMQFLEENEFLLNNDDRESGNAPYFFIGAFKTYDSHRKIYNILNDTYLFGRGDTFRKTDIQDFKDTLYIREWLDIPIYQD